VQLEAFGLRRMPPFPSPLSGVVSRFATIAVSVIALVLIALPQAAPVHAKTNCKNTGSFSAWLRQYKRQAAAEGVSRRTIDQALGGMTLSQKVIRRDRRQGFFAQGFDSFSKKLATPNRHRSAQKKIAQRRKFFDRAEREFGVPPAVIAAFWALESDFGVGMGNLPVLRSLATLAYDCRRGEMFTGELTAALKIIDKGDLTPSDMIGSWAGELGQIQFLPRHYLDHAIDYDGDGRANLFKSDGDIIGSGAAFIKHLGWKRGEPWLEQVTVPDKLPWDQADLTILHPVSQWREWGVRPVDPGSMQTAGLPASLLLPMGRKGPAFLAYENFRVYTEWNHSLTYATTAAYLATRVDGKKTMLGRDRDFPRLDVEQTKQLQRLLARRGFDVGKADGIIGAKTRAAVKTMQQRLGLPADSFPTPELLRRIQRS